MASFLFSSDISSKYRNRGGIPLYFSYIFQEQHIEQGMEKAENVVGWSNVSICTYILLLVLQNILYISQPHAN